MMFPHLEEELKQHASDMFPQEACGLVVTQGSEVIYEPCTNIAPQPELAFNIDKDVIAHYMRDECLQAIVHSHPYPAPAAPSLRDMQSQMAFKLPWGIVPVGANGEAGTPFWWGDGVPVADLLDRPYRHGVTDCYGLIRDWYRLERDITLPDFPRGFAWWDMDKAMSMYLAHYEAAGAVCVDDEPQVGDVCLIRLGKIISHAGIVIEPGVMLHHPSAQHPYAPGRKPKRDVVARWRNHITHVLRYNEVGDIAAGVGA